MWAVRKADGLPTLGLVLQNIGFEMRIAVDSQKQLTMGYNSGRMSQLPRLSMGLAIISNAFGNSESQG
jgi:hypothetical protein